METIGLTARLHLFRFAVGQAYLWCDDDGLTLIDTGIPGSGQAIGDAITGLGLDPDGLRRVVLTHFHGAHLIAIPGHTDGSIAVHLPEHGVLFTGDTVAEAQGTVMLGVFNLDRAQTVASFRRLAELETEIACFGHGDPVLGGAGARLRATALDG